MVALLRQQLEEEEGKFPVSVDDANEIHTKEKKEGEEDMPKQKYFKLALILLWLMIWQVLEAVRGGFWWFIVVLELTVLCHLKYCLASEF